MPADPIPESPGARQPMEESTVAADGLGGGERLASTVDGSTTVPEVMTKTTGSLGVEAGATDATPVFRTEGPAVPEEQVALPEASEGVVGHAIR